MGIKFTCPHCNSALNVKSNLAGKRGRCPKCEAKIDIPAEGGVADVAAAPGVVAAASPVSPPAAATSATQATPAASPARTAAVVPLLHEEATASVAAAGRIQRPDPIAESPQMQWYVMPPGAGSQYGPAAGDAFRGWIKEGRVAPDSLVWRQDWPEWKRAGNVFPELDPTGGVPSHASAVATGFAIPTAVGAFPTATGILPMAGAIPMAGVGFPAAAAAGDFPLVPSSGGASSIRRTQYRPRSNTGPVVAIVVLVILMIPLAFFVIKVISDQWSQPPPAPAAGPESPDQ